MRELFMPSLLSSRCACAWVSVCVLGSGGWVGVRGSWSCWGAGGGLSQLRRLPIARARCPLTPPCACGARCCVCLSAAAGTSLLCRNRNSAEAELGKSRETRCVDRGRRTCPRARNGADDAAARSSGMLVKRALQKSPIAPQTDLLTCNIRIPQLPGAHKPPGRKPRAGVRVSATWGVDAIGNKRNEVVRLRLRPAGGNVACATAG